jgi:hypothetical protein
MLRPRFGQFQRDNKGDSGVINEVTGEQTKPLLEEERQGKCGSRDWHL